MRFFIYAVILVFIGGFITTTASASSCCDQKFTIHGKTTGEYSLLMYDVYWGGDCLCWSVHTVYLGIERTMAMETNIGLSSGRDWIPMFLSQFPLDTQVELPDSNGIYYINDSMYITPPPKDSTFEQKYIDIMRDAGADERDWYRECQYDCNDYPEFFGFDAKLVHSYSRGLYKNYGIKEVIYFPESGYLAIITDQPHKAAGLDTMHGMLVYRLNPKE